MDLVALIGTVRKVSLTSIQGFLSWAADVQALTMPWLLSRANSGPQRWRPRMPKCTEEAEIWDSTIAPPSIPSREIQPGTQISKYHEGFLIINLSIGLQAYETLNNEYIRRKRRKNAEITYVAGTASQHTVIGTGRCSLHQDLGISLHYYTAGWHSRSHLEIRTSYYFQHLEIFYQNRISDILSETLHSQKHSHRPTNDSERESRGVSDQAAQRFTVLHH